MSDLVGCIGVVERPAAAAVNQQAVLVVLVRPQSRDAARLVMLALELGVDPVVGIERRNEDIGEAGVALGVAGLACKLDTDLPELGREGRIQDRLGIGRLACGLAPR